MVVTQDGGREPRRVTILGSTGSVGTQTIDLVARDPAAFAVEALTANRNVALLARQARELGARLAVVADPAAKAALEKTLPTLAKHPAFEQFKSMSLRELQAYAEGQITNEMVAKVDADLKALSAKP